MTLYHFAFCMERLDLHWGYSSVVVHLSSVFKALDSILNTMKEIKKEVKKEEFVKGQWGKASRELNMEYIVKYIPYISEIQRILWERKQTIQADGIISDLIQQKKSIFLSVMKPYRRGIYQSGQRC